VAKHVDAKGKIQDSLKLSVGESPAKYVVARTRNETSQPP
jgi:hypothetical protein